MSTWARAAVGAGFLLCFAGTAAAYGDAVPGAYIEGGSTKLGGVDADAVSIGAVLPWTWSGVDDSSTTGRSFAWDLFASGWQAPSMAGRRNYAQLGAIASWRYRFDRGASPWFVDGGIGVSVLNHVYRTNESSFSTAFQFTEVVGLGRSFGERGEHELSLRLQHFSNASIKRPNPGANFVRLRYLYRF